MPNCQTCQKQFNIEADDKKLYTQLGIADPKECPMCRQRSRLAWRCERSLNYRKCDLCGKEHMSSYRTNARFPVYCLNCYFGDKWNQLATGRDFDFSRSFFEQFGEMQSLCPRASLFITQGTIFNSDYANAVTAVKNCYLVFGSNDVEDSYYSNFAKKSSNVFDCTEIFRSEKCYDCVNCDKSYNLISSNNSRNCRDCYFIEDCSGCHDCFGCVNLRNRSFCLWNKQLTEGDYRQELSQINLGLRQQYVEF